MESHRRGQNYSFKSLAAILIVCPVLLGGCADAPARYSGGPLPDEQAAYDVTYYDLAVSVFPGRERIEGRLEAHVVAREPLDVFVLNLDRRLSVAKASTSGKGPDEALSWERRANGNELWIDLGKQRPTDDTIRVSVRYEGAPRVAPRPPWEGGFTWATTADGDPWVATSGQMEGPDLWWPVKDHPSDEPDSMAIAVTVPDSLMAASNGVLESVESASDSTQTYQWGVSTPINTYGVALNIGPYTRIDTSYQSTGGTSIPVSFYVLPADRTQARRALPGFLSQLRFLEETLGPYPFRDDKYGIAQTPFLGMEHQTIIAYGHDFTTGGLGYEAPFDALHFHELAHEWYGNAVTVEDWKDFWVHEGPATYLEALYAEHLEGDSAYHAVVDHFRTQIEGGIPIARRTPTTAQDIYHRDVYYRGALTLHTLRYVLGEETLRKILRRFLHPRKRSDPRSNLFRHVTTDDFIRVSEHVASRSLDAFYQVYLYQPSLPVLDTIRASRGLKLRWRQTEHANFEVPVPVVANGDTQRINMSGGTGRVQIADTTSVQIDPNDWILRRR